MRTLPRVATPALLASVSCGTDGGTRPAGSASFDPDDGCSLAVGPFAISSEYIRREDMWGGHPDGPAPTYGPVDADLLVEQSLPTVLDGLEAQSMQRTEDSLVVFYGDSLVGSGFQSDLTATGGLVVTRRRSGMTGQESLRNIVDLVGDRITPVQIGAGAGWVGQVDGDHEGARSRPQQVNWVEDHHQITVVGVRDPAELVVIARSFACDQAS